MGTTAGAAGPAAPVAAIGPGGLDWSVAGLSGWLVGGIWLDAWAHHAFPQLETFLTPWHGALYSGFLALATVLVGVVAVGRWRGRSWRGAVPAGYGASLVGVLVFLAGGVGDMLWHQLFGIEVDLEALLSPTHLLLAVGGVLMVAGPLRAAWRRPSDADATWAALLPALLALAFVLSLLTFFTSYANPFNLPWPGRDQRAILAELGRERALGVIFPAEVGQTLGVASILLQAGLVAGALLLAVWRWGPPPGALTLVLGLNTALSVTSHGQYQFVPVGLLAGVAADLLAAWLRPTPARPSALRLFAFAAPAALFALYFLALALAGGVAWTVHLWAGAIALAGAVGLLLSYLLLPPVPPRDGRATA